LISIINGLVPGLTLYQGIDAEARPQETLYNTGFNRGQVEDLKSVMVSTIS
jgi:hypothetical protein